MLFYRHRKFVASVRTLGKDMRPSHQSKFAETAHACPRMAPAIAFLLLISLGTQFSRVYFAIPFSEAMCPMATGAECPMHHMHDATCSRHAGQEGGCSFQCCKDTRGGVGIIPLSVFGPPTLVSYQQPQSTWLTPPQQSDLVIENPIPPPLQPPRQLT
jgi:hypothetical protein